MSKSGNGSVYCLKEGKSNERKDTFVTTRAVSISTHLLVQREGDKGFC